MRLLIAASGTGGHLFPALAVAEQLPEASIQWLGVSDRLDKSLIPSSYPLHTISSEGFQDKFSLKTLFIFQRFVSAIFQVKQLLQQQQIDLVFTTGGYIAAPAILAARWANIPVILHESNYFPGKVTRFFSRWCHTVALGFAETNQYLPHCPTVWVGNPVRKQFLQPQPLELPIPPDVPLIVVVGGSQGAVAVNQLVRQAAHVWLARGAFVVHLTGNSDPDWQSLQHPHYIALPFYNNMAGLLQRATLAISRAGSGSLTELAITGTPSILIPYPYAAEDHQSYNARIFAAAKAAEVIPQAELTPQILQQRVSELLFSDDDEGLDSPTQLEKMSTQANSLAVLDSAQKLATLLMAKAGLK